MPPEPGVERANRRHGDDLAALQLGLRCEPAITVAEILVAAEVEDAPHVRELGRVVQPGTAVKDRYAAHPVRVLVENEQVERLPHAAQEGKREVMKIAGTQERDRRRQMVLAAK